MSERCACRGENDHKVHTPSYCGSIPYDEAFPPYPLEPKYLRGSMPRTNRIKVSLTLDLPNVAVDATPAQIEEWLRFQLGDNSLQHPSPVSEESLSEPLIFNWEWSI